jgi:hypothetical protein
MFFENWSDKKLEKRIEIMAEKMVSGGSTNNSGVAYGAAIIYGMLVAEQEERMKKKAEAEGRWPHKSVFCFKVAEHNGMS